MRILHISTRLILGGSQENTVLSCEGQTRLGHEMHLAFGPIYGPEGSLLERVQKFRTADGRGIMTHIVPDMIRAIHPWRDLKAKSQLRDLITRLKPDIVHTHSSKAGIIGRAAAWEAFHLDVRRDPAPPEGPIWMCGIVHTIHGPPFMPIEGTGPRRAKTRVVNKIYELAEQYAARRCHRIVAVCDEMTRQFLARGIGRPDQYTTVYSGMETARFLTPEPGESREEVRSRLGIAPDRFVIGTVARLAEHKGHDDLLAALGGTLRQRPDWTLLWVGDGWWRERLVARARQMGLSVGELDKSSSLASPADSPHQVLLTGLVPPDRVPGLIRAMDVLAHPSSREGLPRTVPQALLCGVCPVAYDVDGTREACMDGQTGRLAMLGDLAGLREAITDLHDHPHQRTALAHRGREMCREQFSTETMVRDLERVYARAIEAAGGRPKPPVQNP